MTRFFSCVWSHASSDYPVFLASEIDADGYESRKVEIWFDGRAGWADKHSNSSGTILGDQPIPSLDEINESDEFSAHEITGESFEMIWNMRNQPKAEQGGSSEPLTRPAGL